MSAQITSPNDTVNVEIRDSICWITFSRPKSLNAINEDLVGALAHITSELANRSDVRAVVIDGEGDHFMAGGDIKKFKVMLDEESDKAALKDQFGGLLHEVHDVIFNMRALPQPILASVKGAVAGAGVSFMLACDLVLAADNAFFTLAYCHLGVSPDGGSTYHLPRVVGMKRAFEIALLGDRFDAETAERWGMINKVVPADELAAETEKLAKRLANGPSQAHARAKKLLNASLHNSIETQLNGEITAFADCTATDDFSEGVNAFIEKRPGNFKGS